MYKVFAIPSGYAVSFVRPDGKATIHTEHGTRDSAERHADTLNETRRAEAERQRLRDIANRDTFGNRRPVRWFEPDAFA